MQYVSYLFSELLNLFGSGLIVRHVFVDVLCEGVHSLHLT